MTRLAQRIVDDILSLAQFEPREDELADMACAYRVQREVNDILLESRQGRLIAGYKIAFNRQSSMDYYRLAEPCRAPIFSDQVHVSDVVLPAEAFRDLVIEPEIALRLKTGLSGEETLEQMAAAVEAWLPAIEIMDARGAFPRDPSAAAAVAQRVHNEGAVLGIPSDGPVDVAAVSASVAIDGQMVASAVGNAPQPPLEALRWLAQSLARDGLSLEAGMVVLTGAHLPGWSIAQPAQVDVELAPLGRVSMRLV